MSDWEEATIGDPAADFAMLQSFTPDISIDGKPVWGMQQALDYYREVSGINIPLASLQYYQIVRALSTVAFAHKAALATHERLADIR